jgi:hypothetical protein
MIEDQITDLAIDLITMEDHGMMEDRVDLTTMVQDPAMIIMADRTDPVNIASKEKQPSWLLYFILGILL